jgi:hypothetical protein
MKNASKLMSVRYTNMGINTISDVEIFQAKTIVKNENKKIYHLRLDYNEISSAWDTLSHFLTITLPTINNRFILIITGEDLTIPNQIDPRWQEPYQLNIIKEVYNSIINHHLLIHCYIENRDEIHEKSSSIPIGINPREMPLQNVDYILKYMQNIPLIESRELKVICIHRDRQGDREKINKIKNKEWNHFTITDLVCHHDSWYKLLQTYPFIICAHGGGIDPSPKVWEALCLGCIPIIKHSPLDDIYNMFPVVFVNDWTSDSITLEKLIFWKSKYSHFFDNNEMRNTWVHKLYLKYWEDTIKNTV